MPNTQQVPSFLTTFVETPSPINPLGAKGVGEGGTIGSPPAIVNAVLDALCPARHQNHRHAPQTGEGLGEDTGRPDRNAG